MGVDLFINILGWIGSAAVIAAYGLNSYRYISSNSWSFLLLNFLGAGLLVVYTLYKGAYANSVLNVIWMIIAIPAIIRMFRPGGPTRSQ